MCICQDCLTIFNGHIKKREGELDLKGMGDNRETKENRDNRKRERDSSTDDG